MPQGMRSAVGQSISFSPWPRPEGTKNSASTPIMATPVSVNPLSKGNSTNRVRVIQASATSANTMPMRSSGLASGPSLASALFTTPAISAVCVARRPNSGRHRNSHASGSMISISGMARPIQSMNAIGSPARSKKARAMRLVGEPTGVPMPAMVAACATPSASAPPSARSPLPSWERARAAPMAMGASMSVVAVLEIHIEISAEAHMKPATKATGRPPASEAMESAMRSCSRQRSMHAASMKPPMNRNTIGSA